MNAGDPDAAATAAGREALVQRDVALARGETFAIETTFSGNSERRLIPEAQGLGYRVSVTYIVSTNRSGTWPASSRRRRRSAYGASVVQVAGSVPKVAS